MGKISQHLEGVDQFERAAGVLLRLLRATLGDPDAMDRYGAVAFLLGAAGDFEREGSIVAAGLLREWAEDLDGVAGSGRSSGRLVN